MKVPTWRITPGATIEALICATPPITACLPRIGTSRSGASMPFCSGITAVSRPDQRLDVLARALDVPQLDAEQHEVDRPDGLRIVGRLGRHEMRLAAAALDLEAVALHGREMRAAGDEGHVRAGLCQGRAEAAADAAGPHHRYTHMTLPSKSTPSVQATMVGLLDLDAQGMIGCQPMRRAVDRQRRRPLARHRRCASRRCGPSRRRRAAPAGRPAPWRGCRSGSRPRPGRPPAGSRSASRRRRRRA